MQATLLSNYLDDDAVANFARQSFGKLAENFSPEDNAKLIRFLARGMSSGDWSKLIEQLVDCKDADTAHELLVYVRKIPEHWVPFGHPQLTFRVAAPIPIARQMFKHKIGMVESEESRRYVSYEPTFFFPEYFRPAAPSVKQGSADEPHYNNAFWMGVYTRLCEHAKHMYLEAIEDGVCAEQARLLLPQGTEVNWVLTGSLYAFANLYNQRSDSHAQIEIQDLANSIGEQVAPLYPVAWDALTDGIY